MKFLKSLLFVFLMAGHVWGSSVIVCDDAEDPPTLDPHKQFSEKNHTLVQQIFEGLVRFNPEGKIEPSLALSWERQDPLTMRFHLRQDVRFHNGESFNSESVRFTIQRYLDPATGFPAFGFISSLQEAVVVNDYTIDIKTKFPDGLLLNRLAGFVLIVPPGFVQEEGKKNLHQSPVGTGPFMFEKWEKGNRIVLKKNKNYWMKGYPKINKLIFKFIPYDEQLEELFEGKIDILTELPGTRTTHVMENGFARIIKKDSFYTMTAALNVSSGPLVDVRVRRALNHAIKKEDLIRYDVFGNGYPIATFSMPGEGGHNPNLKPYSYVPKRVHTLLKQAGYSKGELVLQALVKDQAIRAAKIIQKHLKDLGIKMNIHLTTDATILKDTLSKKWDILFGAVPDPMCHSYFIQSINLYSKSPYSLGKYPKFDRMLEEMVVTLDPKERDKKARAIDKFIYDEALSLFTYQRIKTYAVNRKVKFKPSVTGMSHFYLLESNAKN